MYSLTWENIQVISNMHLSWAFTFCWDIWMNHRASMARISIRRQSNWYADRVVVQRQMLALLVGWSVLSLALRVFLCIWWIRRSLSMRVTIKSMLDWWTTRRLHRCKIDRNSYRHISICWEILRSCLKLGLKKSSKLYRKNNMQKVT